MHASKLPPHEAQNALADLLRKSYTLLVIISCSTLAGFQGTGVDMRKVEATYRQPVASTGEGLEATSRGRHLT